MAWWGWQQPHPKAGFINVSLTLEEGIMIRSIKNKDKNSISEYLAKKLSISYEEAQVKSKRLLKAGLPSFIKEAKSLQGICWIENIIVSEQKVKKLSFLCDNWKLAEEFIKLLRWHLDGVYQIEVPKHDFLNRTLNKNGFRFVRLENEKNIYNYKFELRTFHTTKAEDND